MALPVSGALAMSQVNTELKKTETQTISLNDPIVRSLAQKSAGQISMFDLLGKTATSGFQYISGGPYNSGGILFYGWGTSSWGKGGSRIGPAQSIGTGKHVITGVYCDGSSNFIITVTPDSEPVGIKGKICRITNAAGASKDIVFGSSAFQYYVGFVGGYYTLNKVTYGFPPISPAGSQYTMEII